MLTAERRRTTAHYDAPVHNPTAAEIEVTDPAHPLFGRRFQVVSVTRSPRARGHVYVAYRERMLLRIPIPATSLQPVRRGAATKLTLEAIQEVVTLAGESEDPCPSSHATSGSASPETCAAMSRPTSPRCSGR